MADLKISQLISATALAGTEVVPVVQGGATKKATIDQILAPASGKGINFAAAGGDTLTIYDEGTWTPALKFDGGMSGSFTYTKQIGTFTRVGRLMTARFQLKWTAIPSAGQIMVIDLPVNAASAGNVQGFISAQGGITNTGTYAITGGDGLVITSYIAAQCAIATVKSGAVDADPLQKSALTSASGYLNGTIIYEV